MDRNCPKLLIVYLDAVALRKESVDRNSRGMNIISFTTASLSARRAWIEIDFAGSAWVAEFVALRKESVDRNYIIKITVCRPAASLSARRAWIEIDIDDKFGGLMSSLSARRAWIEINAGVSVTMLMNRRSPQGERG